MKWYECFCDKDVDITEEDHVWTLMPQATVTKLESSIEQPDGLDFFLDTYKPAKGPSQEGILCPFCKGFTIYELRGNRFASLYHLPEQHYEPYSLALPERLQDFTCTCGAAVDVKDLNNQWTMVPEEELAFEPLIEAFEQKQGRTGYYAALYQIGRRVISCPHCSGVTVVRCDSKGNGLSADYYVRKDELIGDEFDLDLLYD